MTETPPQPSAVGEWYFASQGQRTGPVTEEVIRGCIAGGHLDSGVQLWRAGMGVWMPITLVPEFARDIREHPLRPPMSRHGTPDPTTLLIGLHDPGQTNYHQGRVLGSVDSLIFGILSLVLPCIGVIFAIMVLPVASKAIAKSREERGVYSGVGMAVAGRVLAIISLILHGAVLLLMVAYAWRR